MLGMAEPLPRLILATCILHAGKSYHCTLVLPGGSKAMLSQKNPVVRFIHRDFFHIFFIYEHFAEAVCRGNLDQNHTRNTIPSIS